MTTTTPLVDDLRCAVTRRNGAQNQGGSQAERRAVMTLRGSCLCGMSHPSFRRLDWKIWPGAEVTESGVVYVVVGSGRRHPAFNCYSPGA